MAVPHGILNINITVTDVTTNILTDYHYITDVQVIDACTVQTNQRAIENNKEMLNCTNNSIKGALKDIIFTQLENVPTHSDGIALFKNSRHSKLYHH